MPPVVADPEDLPAALFTATIFSASFLAAANSLAIDIFFNFSSPSVKSKFLKDIAASNTCFNTFLAVMAKADIFTLLSSINLEKLFKIGINVLYRFLISVRGFIA